MGKQKNDKLKERNEELTDLLEDLIMQIQEIREEIIESLDNLEDMITEAWQVCKQIQTSEELHDPAPPINRKLKTYTFY